MARPKLMKISEARQSFFIEDEGAPDGFVKERWRGAVVDRDAYGLHAMPRILWEALREASGDEPWWICGYVSVGEPEANPISFGLDWNSFPAVFDRMGYSPEWVAYNESQTIAFLVEFDVTIVGASQARADDVDRILEASGTSLRQLTHADFADPGRLEGFLKAVTK
ncbi:MAG: hypothetical protein ABWX83_07580 [Luteibacter sp.]